MDEVLVEIETDKAAMDLPAPTSGILLKILKKDGEEAAPGDVIATIDESAKGPSKGQGKDGREARSAAKQQAGGETPRES